MINEIQDETLKRKALSLPHLIESAYAKPTLKKYKKKFTGMRVEVDSLDKILFKSQPLPGEPFHVAIYLNDVVSSMQTEGALTSAFLAIRRGHYTSGHPSPTEHPLVKQSLEGRKNSFITRRNEKFLQKRNPTADLLKQFVNHFSPTSHLIKIRFVVLTLLGFFSFLQDKQITVYANKIFDF